MTTRTTGDRALLHAGRGLIALLFVLAGINKLINRPETVAMMRDGGLPWPELLVYPTLVLEIGGGLLLLTGGSAAAVAAITLALFTLATNALFHRFWDLEDPTRGLQLSLFVKNLAVIGGLLLIARLARR
jgi:putative oxidoreductase